LLKAVAASDHFFVSSRLRPPRGANYLKRQRSKEGVPIMADDPNAQENIEIPPIPKETAGAVAGAALGSMVGPAGAVVGGIVGAIAGKAASERRLGPAAKKAVARIVKPALARPRTKKTSRVKAAKRRPAKSRKRSAAKRTKAKPRRRSTSSRGKARRRRR